MQSLNQFKINNRVLLSDLVGAGCDGRTRGASCEAAAGIGFRGFSISACLKQSLKS